MGETGVANTPGGTAGGELHLLGGRGAWSGDVSIDSALRWAGGWRD